MDKHPARTILIEFDFQNQLFLRGEVRHTKHSRKGTKGKPFKDLVPFVNHISEWSIGRLFSPETQFLMHGLHLTIEWAFVFCPSRWEALAMKRGERNNRPVYRRGHLQLMPQGVRAIMAPTVLRP
jgi:hypothetical protein